MDRTDPYLSVVVTSRNDDFGGGMLRRLQLFLENFLVLGSRHGLDAELILVEWNPPPGPRLHEVLRPRSPGHRFPVRFIEVPARIHARYPGHEALPLFQMIAKNVGIRRARGEYILATNQDVLLNDALFAFLASRSLQRRTLYRIDRFDCHGDVPIEASVDEQLSWCEKHGIRINTRHGTFPLRNFGSRPLSQRWPRGATAAEQLLTPRRARRLGAALWKKARSIFTGIAEMHTNGCGDFTLCHRDHWHAVRGYVELPSYSLYLDSLFCYMLAAIKLREKFLSLPMRCYHREHRDSILNQNPQEKLQRFAATPWLDHRLLEELRWEMNRRRDSLRWNRPHWGLGDELLLEINGYYQGRELEAKPSTCVS